MLHEVPTCLTGPKRDGVRKVLPESSVNARRWLVEDKRHIGGSPKSDVRYLPRILLEWGLDTEGDKAPRLPAADTLAAHDTVTADCTDL